jgi:hypothetical protein
MTSNFLDHVPEVITDESGPFLIEKVCWESIKKVTRHGTQLFKKPSIVGI